MIVLIQRVKQASCSIDGKIYSQIEKGLTVFLGIEKSDDQSDVSWLASKVANMRIFQDDNNKMNLSCKDVKGSILIISQFTLHASTKKGNRPSFINAASPETALPLYQAFIDSISEEGLLAVTGVFGADMKIALINDGPVTIILDSKVRK